MWGLLWRMLLSFPKIIQNSVAGISNNNSEWLGWEGGINLRDCAKGFNLQTGGYPVLLQTRSLLLYLFLGIQNPRHKLNIRQVVIMILISHSAPKELLPAQKHGIVWAFLSMDFVFADLSQCRSHSDPPTSTWISKRPYNCVPSDSFLKPVEAVHIYPTTSVGFRMALRMASEQPKIKTYF